MKGTLKGKEKGGGWPTFKHFLGSVVSQECFFSSFFSFILETHQKIQGWETVLTKLKHKLNLSLNGLPNPNLYFRVENVTIV